MAMQRHSMPSKCGISIPISFTWYFTPCHQAKPKCMIAIPRIVDGSRISTFSYIVLHMSLLADLAHFLLHVYQQLDAGCLGFKLPQINRPVMTAYF